MPLAEQADLLLVDDRAENLAALETILEPLGQRMARATSGEDALRQLLEREFAVTLLGVQMPRMNGLETAQAIKACERTRYVPIIFLSETSQEEGRVIEGYSAGGVDYLVKPFQPEILRAKVRVFVDLYLQRRRIAEQEQRLRGIERDALAASLASSAGELEELNAELHRRQADLERAITARTRFYASMSHELRTPINAVLGYSTLLLEQIYGPLNEKQSDGIERTQKAARHLLELVNDVLDLSKIEAGKIDLRLQPVAFPGLIEDLFVTVRPLADEHGSVLSLDCAADRAISIVSDPRRLRQILLNVISNAIKFGKGKPITVVCTPTEDGGVAIDVIDRGEGISNEDQERIFHEFVQLGKSQLQDGTGLGLPISRRLAELLRGALTVDSAIGRGSTFRLRLPASADARPIRLVDQGASLPVHADGPLRRSSVRAPDRPRPGFTAESEPG